MMRAAACKNEGTRLDQCAYSMQSMGIWRLTKGDRGPDRG